MQKDDELKAGENEILDAQMNIFEIENIDINKKNKKHSKEEIIDGQIDLFSMQENEIEKAFIDVMEQSKNNLQSKSINKKDKKNKKKDNIKETLNKENKIENKKISEDNIERKIKDKSKKNTKKIIEKSEEIINDIEEKISSRKEITKDNTVKGGKMKNNGSNGGGQGMMNQSIEQVLHNSMIPYSEFVLMDRALPRVEDGLKPVQRRILYCMMDLGLTPDKAFRKSAHIVGDCLGRFHPHGDTSVYDAMVRMAQPFNMRECLVTGHGNFGSMDGDSAAAMRYTEAKLAPIALELLRDIDKNTVPFSLNYDDTLQEPDVLPGRYPNLLVNGAMGIAVGLATNIPPHNLGEVIDAVVAMIDSPNISLKELMKIIKGPDFPTGGIISKDELYQAYDTGKGKITIRAKVDIEKGNGGKQDIIISEIPYQKNKANLLAKIADLREDKKGILLGISDIRDETDRNGVRAVIQVKEGFDVDKILAVLYKYSDLETTFGINMVAIADGKPKQMSLIDILSYYINYQINVIVRRTKFDLDASKERMHILQGLYIAIQNIDEVVAIIKKSQSTQEAKITLCKRFDLSERQAQAILDMRLARLTSLEVYKIEQEMKELDALIKKLTAILNSKHLQKETLKEEILEIKTKYASPRSTKIVKEFSELDVKQILEESKPIEDVIVMLTRAGTIKRMTQKQFTSAVKDFNDKTTESEMHYNIIETQTDKILIAFTNKGNACRVKVEDLKEFKWREKGATLRSLFKELDVDEQFVAMYEMNEKTKSKQLLFITKQGMLKLTELGEYDLQKQVFTAIKLKGIDQVLSVSEFKPKKNIVMVSENGMILHCDSSDVPLQARMSMGVKGMVLNEKDQLSFASQVEQNDILVLLTKYGFSKRIKISALDSLLPRARKGVKIFALPVKDYVLFGAIADFGTEFALKVDGNFTKKLTNDFYADTRQGKGKSITSSKGGDKIDAIYVL